MLLIMTSAIKIIVTINSSNVDIDSYANVTDINLPGCR